MLGRALTEPLRRFISAIVPDSQNVLRSADFSFNLRRFNSYLSGPSQSFRTPERFKNFVVLGLAEVWKKRTHLTVLTKAPRSSGNPSSTLISHDVLLAQEHGKTTSEWFSSGYPPGLGNLARRLTAATNLLLSQTKPCSSAPPSRPLPGFKTRIYPAFHYNCIGPVIVFSLLMCLQHSMRRRFRVFR